MFDNFRRWYLRNYESITWFLIGFVTLNLFNNIGRGNWMLALFDVIIIAANYAFVSRR
jgi:hypothetical protein